MSPAILLTGGTGFVGGAVLAHLLSEHPEVEIFALARAAGNASPRARVVASVRRFLPRATEAELARLQVVGGTLTDDSSLLALPWQHVTHIVHLAVDSSASSQASLTNVTGTRALAQLAARARQLVRFLYVGSAWSCGLTTPQDQAVQEDDYAKVDGELTPTLAPYLTDKVGAEHQLAGLAELPLTVAIPSLTAGHTRLGCRPSASLFWVFRLLDRAACIPWQRSHRLDVVPVDWLAAALVRLLLRPTLAHRRYHLSAGAGSGVTWAELESAFARAHGAARNYRYQGELTFELAWPAGNGRTQGAEPPSLARAPNILTPEKRWTLLQHCLKFLATDVIFDNSRALALGIPAPAKLTSYVELCLRSAQDRTIEMQALDDV